MSDSKLACITIDIEADFTTKPSNQRYYGMFDAPGQFDKFRRICSDYDLNLSCFVVGSVLEDRPEFIEKLALAGAEFGSHSRTHDLTAQTSEYEVVGGIEHFERFFGKLPLGYRSPRGKYNKKLLKMLHESGIKYDSSVIPSIRPGTYSNLDKPQGPFRWKDLSLLELPISVTGGIRVPIALSYMKVLGKGFFNHLMARSSTADPIVFLLHPMDLYFIPEAFNLLSFPWAVAYSRNRNNSWEYFELFISSLRDAGYQFVPMSHVYDACADSDLVEVELN